MESYKSFLNRISQFETKDLNLYDHHFDNNISLMKKVYSDGKFRKFYGDTIVFDLSDEVKDQLNAIVNTLYEECPTLFAERLKKNTFHITLHDLASSMELEEAAVQTFENEILLANNIERFKETKKEIKLRTNFVFDMVNTSLVIGVVPVSEKGYETLFGIHDKFNSLQRLTYPYTPHITLAYYRPHPADEEEVEKLKEVVAKLNETGFDFSVNTKNLFYQKFKDMNDYTNIISIVK